MFICLIDCLLVRLFVRLAVFLSIIPSFACLSIPLFLSDFCNYSFLPFVLLFFAYLSDCLRVRLSGFCNFAFLYISVYVCSSVYLPVCPTVCPTLCLYLLVRLSDYFYVCMIVCLTFYKFVYLSDYSDLCFCFFVCVRIHVYLYFCLLLFYSICCISFYMPIYHPTFILQPNLFRTTIKYLFQKTCKKYQP